MIIKSADDKEASIKLLEAIKRFPGLSAHKRTLVEEEIRTTKAGMRGEAETAYHIDFHLSESRNTMVLHDLRFELEDGRSAQIDHLLIHCTGQIWVLESKRVASGIKITEDGEFLRWNGRSYEGMASPISQNQRHVEVLREGLRWMESSFRIDTIHAYVIVSPKARIDRPRKGTFDTALVVKADLFMQKFEKDLDKVGFLGVLGGLLSAGGHRELAEELVTLHRPIAFDYASRFNVPREALDQLLNPACDPDGGPTSPPQSVASGAEQASAALPAAVVSPVATVAHRCRHCQSTALAVAYGQYGYYFKCGDCQGNTPIRVSCGNDGHKERIRKDGRRFFRECAACDTSRLFYING
jgi:hypothetical protein